MLADDIITLLSDESSSLTQALYKTKIFLHEIGKKELADWVTHELSGYPDAIELPEYRVLKSRVLGNLIAPRWKANAQAIPILHLEPAYREKLETSEIRESLKLVEELSTKEQGSVRRFFPPEANSKLGSNLGNGWQINEAWTEVSVLDIQNILVQVRSRLLDFMLELKNSVTDIGNGELNRANAENIDTNTIFNNTIFGHNATVIVGHNNRQKVQFSSIENDLDQLKRVLTSIGIPVDELSSLQTAIEADHATGRKPSFDGETGNWFTRLVGRAAKGGLSVGVDVVSSTVAKALTSYMGGGA